MTESPFTVYEPTTPRAKPDLSGFTYRVEYTPHRDPYAFCRIGRLAPSSVTGTAPSFGAAMLALMEHVNRLSEYCVIVSASVVANNR